jgi:hypothetical protein
MKTMTLRIPDDVYKQAERRAAELGSTLDEYVTELVNFGQEPTLAKPAPNPIALLAALDRGRNSSPVGRLNRDELYDRPVLH